jgi:hypothetical protein
VVVVVVLLGFVLVLPLHLRLLHHLILVVVLLAILLLHELLVVSAVLVPNPDHLAERFERFRAA